MKIVWILFFATLLLLGLASHLSGFQLHAPDQLLNWGIVLMLTPYGLIANLIFGLNSSLYPFYFELSSRVGLFNNQSLILVIVGVWIMAFAGLWQFRKSR